MSIFDAIFERKRAESFSSEEVDDKLVGVILHAAAHAPSAGNLKPWEFIVVKKEETKKKISELALKETKLIEAPVLIVVCVDMDKIGLKYPEKMEKYALQDSSAVISYIMLTAKILDLDSDWIRVFDEEKISQLLKLPDNLKVAGIVPIGKGRSFQHESYIPFENITHLEEYGRKTFERIGIKDVLSKILGKLKGK
jgi:nitroreductase